MKTTRRQSPGEVAFTLVEVLVAEAIFLILLLVVMQLIFGALQTTTAQKKRMDELGDARQSLDRLSLDWSSRVRRSDILASFGHLTASSTNAANAQISFLSQVQAYANSSGAPARHVSWVTYCINNIAQTTQGSQSTTGPALARGILGYNFSGSDPTGTLNPMLSFPGTAPTATVTFDPLANTVFRFDFCYLRAVTGGSSSLSPFTINNPTSSTGTDTPVNLSSSNLVGIVVAVASLDQQSRQLVSQAQLVAMGNALTITDGQTPQTTWVNAINNGTFSTTVKSGSNVPINVANAVHVYQRIIYVND
jgi:type II secretory pathway pseudopilin PulG